MSASIETIVDTARAEHQRVWDDATDEVDTERFWALLEPLAERTISSDDVASIRALVQQFLASEERAVGASRRARQLWFRLGRR